MSLKIFNNLLVYRMTDAAAFHALKDELNELLAERPARLPSKSELSTEGFCEPLGIDDEYVEHVRAKTMVITVNFAQRMLPAKVVRQRLASAVREIEQNEERKVYAREKNQIKDRIISGRKSWRRPMKTAVSVNSSRIGSSLSPTACSA